MNQQVETAQREFYEHLKRHPGAHASARSFVAKLSRQDPKARRALRRLASSAHQDLRAANALRILAVTSKYEGSPMFMGGTPAVVAAGTKILRLALSPAAWILSQGGSAFHWAGRSLQRLATVI